MTENIKHFETLWEESEAISSKKYQDTSTGDISNKVVELLKSYKELDSINPPEVASSIKAKQLGEIVFLLTALSLRDDINVYAALKEQLLISDII